jgi:hypothetical protein
MWVVIIEILDRVDLEDYIVWEARRCAWGMFSRSARPVSRQALRTGRWSETRFDMLMLDLAKPLDPGCALPCLAVQAVLHFCVDTLYSASNESVARLRGLQQQRERNEDQST